ncbi:hypothetical protein [Psychromarinibacter halotolerans]|uniref:RES domain-containing protein n=1 Tax=Psychromarinibacter halotolerans TaxID=1775175 RepID=A0ABV7GNX7_9RHOB|nr:hypothetical protein [Psychromarinibacter halotolerans]MDF0595546.1 hypothetical protein [Psychromarinibacter halotolerans]
MTVRRSYRDKPGTSPRPPSRGQILPFRAGARARPAAPADCGQFVSDYLDRVRRCVLACEEGGRFLRPHDPAPEAWSLTEAILPDDAGRSMKLELRERCIVPRAWIRAASALLEDWAATGFPKAVVCPVPSPHGIQHTEWTVPPTPDRAGFAFAQAVDLRESAADRRLPALVFTLQAPASAQRRKP